MSSVEDGVVPVLVPESRECRLVIDDRVIEGKREVARQTKTIGDSQFGESIDRVLSVR